MTQPSEACLSVSSGSFFLLFSIFSIRVWNCQRAKHKLFRCVVRDLVRDRKPDILVIIEPRISGRQGDTVSRINRCRGRVSSFFGVQLRAGKQDKASQRGVKLSMAIGLNGWSVQDHS